MADNAPAPRPDQPRPLPLQAAFGGLKHGFEALGVRNYRLYWLGQVVSLIGTWMQQVSLPWLVLSLGGSPIQLGIVAVLQFGPSMVLAPFGGVFADRIDKRRALLAAQVAAALQATILFGLTATGVVQIWMVMVMALMLGLVNAIDMPLRQALAPDLVPRSMLANAIALNSMAFNTARVVGPALGRRHHRGRDDRDRVVDRRRGGQPRHQRRHLCGRRHRPRAHGPASDPSARTPRAASARPPQPEGGLRLRGAHPTRAVVPRPARRHRRVRLQLPDPAAAVLSRGARPGT